MVGIKTDKTSDLAGSMIITLSGVVGNGDLEELRELIETIIKGNSHLIICNMSKVETISPESVGLLLELRRRLLDKEGNLVLSELNMRVLEYLNSLDDNLIFKVFQDNRSALDYFRWEYEGLADEVQLTFPSDLSLIPSIRQFVKTISDDKGYGKKDSFRIETIVDEICNNAVEHGSESEIDEVILKIMIDREKIEMSVTNKSLPESSGAIKKMAKFLNEPNTSIEESRGRGLALVRMLSNEVNIESGEHGTSVHVTKIRED